MTDALADAVPGPSPEDTVAAQVRRRREALGLSNGALAARAGISKAMLSKIEHRRTSCSLSTLARLADALAVPVSALLDEAPPGRHTGGLVLYVLEGALVYGHGDARHTLRAGDVLALDGEGEHGPYELLEAPVRFRSVVSREA
ncbi:helix-turn-helix domain-containing protein [Actinomycetospora callitridis]|uniref:helix-turn-helix domain-containing protein n=1 Tax=Actinomycetospora callitridis TaxID=913944 RepID=UPI002366DA11|nr:helix-turn-helix domain-containing protein [Actinomycetospora callitridis]MDD7921557.1 helix-turn-helix domain-containing protein [Actinomycetospora callitridis]